MPKCREFEDGKKRLEAQVEAVIKGLDGMQLYVKDGSLTKPVEEADLTTFAKNSTDRKTQLMGIRYYRRLLCEDNNPHVQKIINMGLVPYFVEALRADDCESLQLEAAWALTNVSAGSCEETRVVIENGALPLLINFTTRSNVDLKEQALWAIGNIAAERSFLKALVEKGALDRVLHVLEMDRGDLRLERISIWALANFCRYGSEAIGLASVILLLDYITRISMQLCTLMKHGDRQVLSDAAWAIASFTTEEWNLLRTKEILVQRGVLKLLTDALIYTERQTLHYPVSKACAQLLSGPESYALEFVSTDGLLPKLKKLVGSHINKKTMSNILWTLQNITANRYRVANKIISSGIVPKIVELVIYGAFDTKIEASTVLINMFCVTDLPVAGLDALIGADTIRALCAMLTWQDTKTVISALEALEKVLTASSRPSAQKFYNLSTVDESYCADTSSKKEKKRVRVKHQGSSSSRFNPVAQRICNAGGKHTLIMLADHDERAIRRVASGILQRYFETEDISSQESTDEESAEVAEMDDDHVIPIEDAASDVSVGARDEMALCEDMKKGFSLWESAATPAK